jgi:hypothetical protein
MFLALVLICKGAIGYVSITTQTGTTGDHRSIVFDHCRGMAKILAKMCINALLFYKW